MTDEPNSDSDSEQYDERRRTDHVDAGASARVEITRGTGTRDQEKYRLEGSGEDAHEALDELKTMVEDITGAHPDDYVGSTGDQLRTFQPGDGDE